MVLRLATNGFLKSSFSLKSQRPYALTVSRGRRVQVMVDQTRSAETAMWHLTSFALSLS